MNSEHEYDPDSSSLSTEVWAALWRQALLADGRSDAFEFALRCDGDLTQLKSQVREIQRLMSDPDMLKGPLASGNGPRIYREGYLVGLKEAINIVSAASVGEEKQAV
jgi:hypothetical protein